MSKNGFLLQKLHVRIGTIIEPETGEKTLAIIGEKKVSL